MCIFCFRKPAISKQALPECHIINYLLTSLLEPYWGILALGRFCTDLAALGPYCHDLGPIFPIRPSRSVSKRLILHNKTSNKRFVIQHAKLLCPCGRISRIFIYAIFFVTSIQFVARAFRENLFNRSSGVQIPRDICTRFGRYLYSTKCSWIIKGVIHNTRLLSTLAALYLNRLTSATIVSLTKDKHMTCPLFTQF